MKKILSLLLAVILIFSIPCTGVSATETKVDYGADVEGFVGFLNVLMKDAVNISVDRFDETMTRLELAEIVAAILNCTDKETNNFYFADAADKPAVNNLTARNIFKGDDGLFHPDRAVTVGEVYTVLVRTLGYEEYTNKYGKNTAGYALIARNIGLTAENLDVSKNATVGEVAGILTNAIRVPLMGVYGVKADASGESTYLIYGTQEDSRLLNVYHGIDVIEGVVTANQFTAFYTPNGVGDGLISVNDTVFDIVDEALYTYIGQNIIAYAARAKNDGRGKILFMYADEAANDTLTIDLTEVEGYSNYRLRYHANGRQRELSLPENFAVVYNGKALLGGYESYIKKGIGSLKLYKDRKSGNYQVMVIDAYKNIIVKSVNSADSTVYFDDTLIDKIDFGGNDLYYELYITRQGDTINPIQLIPGNLISIAVSQDSKYVKGYVSSERITGRIEKIRKAAGGQIIIMDGTDYVLELDFSLPSGLSVGDYVEIWLDINGKVAFAGTAPKNGNIMMGYVYGGAKVEDTFDNTWKIKVFNEQGEHYVLDLAENIVLNNERESAENALASLCDSRTGDFTPQLIRYSLNSKAQVAEIDTAAASKQDAVNEAEGSLWELTKGFASRKYSSSQRMLMPMYPLSFKTKVFIVPTSASAFSDGKGFAVIDFQQLSPFYNTSSYNTRCYKTDVKTPFADYVVYAEDATPTLSGKGANLMMIVSEIADVLSDGEIQKQITGYVRGNKITLFVDSMLDVSILSEGDAINYVTNTRGEMANMEVLYDVSAEKTSWSEYMDTMYGSLRMGDVIAIYEDPMESSQLAIALGNNGIVKDYFVINRDLVQITVYDSLRRDAKVYMGDANDILDINQYNGSKQQKMLILKNSQFVLEIVLYK